MMEIKIYQINSDRDENRVRFLGLDSLPKFQASDQIDSAIYDMVFDGPVSCTSLEDVYQKFNLDHPCDFKGHSLSVSDVVEVVDSEDVESGFYFCDSIGFKQVTFSPELIPQQGKSTIQVVMLEPGKIARVGEIEASLEGLQKAVGGYIEAIYPFEEQVCIVCNEEGKINGMKLNRAIYAEPQEKNSRREMIDIIAGPCFICDCSGDDFGSLSPEQQRKYLEMFKNPERFARINGEIFAIPYKPTKNDPER